MTKHIASLITDSGLILFVDGTQHVVGNDHPNFGKIKDAMARKDYDAVAELADIRSAVRKWMSKGDEFALEGDLIHLDGVPFSQAVTDKVLAMIDAGNSADPLFNFLRKVRLNPAKHAQDELLLFCVANGFMIHEDGDLVAYKAVRNNYTDIHSGKFSNTIGSVVTMPRGQVDDNRHQTCSTGLHFASHEYAKNFGGSESRLMVMKINPRDVVSIPSDYDNQKGRCCRYEVIAELKACQPLPKKEVYTDSDLGRGTLDPNQEERDRLDTEICGLENDRADLEKRIDKLHRKRAAADSEDVKEALEDKIYDLSCEIESIDEAIERIQEEIENL